MKNLIYLIALSTLSSCWLEEVFPEPSEPEPSEPEPSQPPVDSADCYANFAELPAGPYIEMTMAYPHYCWTQEDNLWIGQDDDGATWLTNGNGGAVEGIYQYDAEAFAFAFTSLDGCLTVQSHIYSVETSPGSATFSGTGTVAVACTVP